MARLVQLGVNGYPHLPFAGAASKGSKAGITKHINWHVFRHTFSTLLAENDEDVKTVQSLMRHANSNITMNIYTHAVSSKKAPGSKHGGGDDSAAGQEGANGGRHRGYGLMFTFLCTTPSQQLLISC